MAKTLDAKDQFAAGAAVEHNTVAMNSKMLNRDEILQMVQSVGGGELGDTRKRFEGFHGDKK